MTTLLEVRDLSVHITSPLGQTIRPVDDVSFELAAGEIVGLVGESGSGKTLTALSILGCSLTDRQRQGASASRATS